MSNGWFADFVHEVTYFHNSNGTASVYPNDRNGIAGDVNYILPSFTVDGQLYLVTQLDFNCPNITSITIPQYVTNINFFGSTNLNAINIDINNTNFSVDNNVIFNKNKTTLIYYLAKPTNSSYTIPSSVTAISNGAFQDASSLTNILIPSSMTTISGGAFSWSFLQKIVIPSSVTIIENYAFSNCNSLNSVFFLGDIPIMNKNSWEQLTTNFTKEVDSVYYITGAQNTDRLIPLFNSVYELSRQQMYTFGGNHLIPAAAPTITNIRSTGGVTSISFQNPEDTSITNYAYSTINVVDIENSVLPPFSSYTLLSPAQTTSPLTINGLHGVVQIKIKAFNGSYSNESTAVNNWYEPPFV
jgi:hypothetical protein